MVSPRRLVECVAAALDLPLPTVVQFDRVLAEAGLRSKGGRGNSAAEVTSTDAANLLISILGSPISGAAVKVADSTCRTYGKLPARLGRDGETLRKFKRLGFYTVSQIPSEHTLRDGVSALIEAAMQGEGLVISDEESDPMVGPKNDRFVSLTLEGPRPWAEIIIDSSLGEANPDLIAHLVYHSGKIAPTQSRAARQHDDFHQSRQVTFRTIRRIGELLARDGR